MLLLKCFSFANKNVNELWEAENSNYKHNVFISKASVQCVHYWWCTWGIIMLFVPHSTTSKAPRVVCKLWIWKKRKCACLNDSVRIYMLFIFISKKGKILLFNRGKWIFFNVTSMLNVGLLACCILLDLFSTRTSVI